MALLVIVALSAIGICIITFAFRNRRHKQVIVARAYDYIDIPPAVLPRTMQTIDSELYETIDFSSNQMSNAESNEGTAVEIEPSSVTGTGARVLMQENPSYQPSTDFTFAANPAYGTNIANAPEITTEDNVAHQRTCS